MKRVQTFIFWQGMKQVTEFAVTNSGDVTRQFYRFSVVSSRLCVK
jgi:hypothetical protein